MADGGADLGAIGARQLLCVQIFDIARHSTTAVAIIPGSFVAVTGKGPGGSNESGKTSWLASVALLLGDPEWRMKGSGPASVADLLFEPVIAGSAAQFYPAATTGYIAGIFADPGDVQASAHSVWMKLSATAPYVKVRHAAGVHLATAHEETERHTQAAEIFRSLPGPSLGSMRYAEELYGPAPRCQAYLESRGRREGGPSLLKLSGLSPSAVGTALVSLTGREPLMERDVTIRKGLSEAINKRDTQLREDGEQLALEDSQLAAIGHRDNARSALATAQELWQLHYARGLIDALERKGELDTALGHAEDYLAACERAVQRATANEDALQDPEALKERRDAAAHQRDRAVERGEAARSRETECTIRHRQVADRIRKAEEEAAGVHGNLDQAQADADQARAGVDQRQQELGVAKSNMDQARSDLEHAETGRYGQAGRTLATLSNAGVRAVGLLDSLDLPATERPMWEARLSLYREAVCIADGDVPAARNALRSLPGAVLVSCPEPVDDSGGEDQVRLFLDELAIRMRVSSDPETAVDQALGLHVLGGFDTPQTGRAALVARLRTCLDIAQVQVQAAHSALQQAQGVHSQANDLVHRLENAALARQLRPEYAAVERELAGLRDVVATRQAEFNDARDRYDQANVAYLTLQAQRDSAHQRTLRAQADVLSAKADRQETKDQLDALDVDYWGERGGTEEAARELLHWPAGTATGAGETISDAMEASRERRTQVTLRKRAGNYLDRAMHALGIDPLDGSNAPTREIKDAVVLRANRTDDSGSRRFADATAFESPANAMGDWLEQLADADEAAARLIEDERAERAEAIAFCQRSVERLGFDLRAQQDAIALLLEQAMDSVEAALTDLNHRAGLYGVEIRREIRPPASLNDLWCCEVTPCWRRTPGGQMLSYRNITNSAQAKLFSIHLVLAALLASPHPRGRVLVLDEVGDTLDIHHRREVLGALTRSATDHGLTVLGTCQETLMDDAADFFGEALYFTYPSHAEALNAPTRMFGYDSNGARIELTADGLLGGRDWW
ncbi:hypothetical protein WKI65_33170 [Streptomyces sp. MS1.AVA.3]|uniref:hypothetical protein n=1 Tax=Streptomyces decoyicus TaxID=249567 RepID=UPI0030C2B807